jgi:hypothetical protein
MTPVPKSQRMTKTWITNIDKTLSVPFFINDGSDRIFVKTENISEFSLPTIEKFEDKPGVDNYEHFPEGCFERKIEISGFLEDEKVFCVGEVNLDDGISIGNGYDFTISDKDEIQVVENLKYSIFFNFIASIVLAYIFYLILYEIIDYPTFEVMSS